MDLKDFVNEEFLNFKNINASIIGIQNYLFAKNLKIRKIKVLKIINWFENSNVDKGWNLGFNKFYPESKTFGYQGYFLEKEWLYIDPSDAEFKFKVIPKKLICIGKKLIKTRKEYCKKLNVKNDINLRFIDLDNNSVIKKKNLILIILNIDIENSKAIIKEILETQYCKNGNKIFIKEHPLLKIKKLNLPNLPENIEVIEGKFSEIVKKFKIVITSGSSSSILEALFAQCFIIFPFNNYFDSFNISQLKISKKRFAVCDNIKKIDKNIKNFLNRKIQFDKHTKAENILGKNWNQKTSKYF